LEEIIVGDGQDRRQPQCSIETADQRVYAAVDLGTNNCRLLIAEPHEDGFKVIDSFSRTTRLGEGLARTGRLSEPAILRTLAALKLCAQKVGRIEGIRVRSVATEACRRAGNCVAFLQRVGEVTGLAMEIISAEEEAQLALAGCASLLAARPKRALVFDIGGGSTELILVELTPGGPSIQSVLSLPVGVVTLTEERGEALYTEDGYAAAVAMVTTLLNPFDPDGSLTRKARSCELQMLGTSGTVTTLAGAHLGLRRYDRALVDGLIMDFSAIDKVSRELARATAADRAAHPCVGQDRADLVVAGCAILEAICRRWPVGRLRVADRGVREGILLSLMHRDRGLDPE
jgi:exopolyphosphatase/guanosine-5'-triphosphate,3'-diphosphate pyrophosphatase